MVKLFVPVIVIAVTCLRNGVNANPTDSGGGINIIGAARGAMEGVGGAALAFEVGSSIASLVNIMGENDHTEVTLDIDADEAWELDKYSFKGFSNEAELGKFADCAKRKSEFGRSVATSLPGSLALQLGGSVPDWDEANCDFNGNICPHGQGHDECPASVYASGRYYTYKKMVKQEGDDDLYMHIIIHTNTMRIKQYTTASLQDYNDKENRNYVAYQEWITTISLSNDENPNPNWHSNIDSNDRVVVRFFAGLGSLGGVIAGWEGEEERRRGRVLLDHKVDLYCNTVLVNDAADRIMCQAGVYASSGMEVPLPEEEEHAQVNVSCDLQLPNPHAAPPHCLKTNMNMVTSRRQSTVALDTFGASVKGYYGPNLPAEEHRFLTCIEPSGHATVTLRAQDNSLEAELTLAVASGILSVTDTSGNSTPCDPNTESLHELSITETDGIVDAFVSCGVDADEGWWAEVTVIA